MRFKANKWKIGAAKTTDITDLKSDIGTMSSLTTTNKNSLVEALNEVRAALVVLTTNYNALVAIVGGYATHTHDMTTGTGDDTDVPN